MLTLLGNSDDDSDDNNDAHANVYLLSIT